MAGEIEEPFRLDFEADSVHSGSISFGRFENEALCWERRSSFSHNRYLEEVEKCSKPGSVIQKKAYFEAHFRKKGFPCLNSPGCKNEADYDTGKDEDISEKMDINEGEIGHMNHDVTCYARFEETEVFGTSFSESHVEFTSESNDSNCNTELVKPIEVDVELGYVSSESGIKMNDNLDGLAIKDESHVPYTVNDKFLNNHENEEQSKPCLVDLQSPLHKERTPSEAEHVKPRLFLQDRVEHKKSYTSSNTSKVIEKKANKTVAVRSKAEKTSPGPKRSSIFETSNYKLGSKSKGVDEFNRSGRKSTTRIIAGPRPSTSEKIRSRVHQSANRFTGPRPSTSEKIPSRVHQSANRFTGPRPSTSEKISNRVHQSANSAAGPRPSTPENISCRVHQSVNRVNPPVSANNQSMRQDNSRFSFKSDERAQRRKEFEKKLEEQMNAREAKLHQIKTMTQEKKDAEIKQLRKSLNFKAKPMPSFYRRASLEPQEIYKAVASNNKAQTQGSKSSTPGSRVSGNPILNTKARKDRPVTRSAPAVRTTDQPQASATSCHSTVTSESSASSRARTSNSHPSLVVSKKKLELEKDKVARFRRNTAPQDNQMFKGKTFNGK